MLPYRLTVVDYENAEGIAQPISLRACRKLPFFVLAYDASGEEIAHGEFYHHGDRQLLMCSDVWVDPDYRRRGIATAIYLEAERVSGKTLHPYPSQYDDGRALWLQPNRPFGRGVPNPDAPVLAPGDD